MRLKLPGNEERIDVPTYEHTSMVVHNRLSVACRNVGVSAGLTDA